MGRSDVTGLPEGVVTWIGELAGGTVSNVRRASTCSVISDDTFRISPVASLTSDQRQ